MFGALTLLGLCVVAFALRRLPETLPVEARVAGGVRALLGAARVLLVRRSFVTAVLALAFGFGALFTYISTSSFVLQDGFGLSAQQFSLVFAVNGAGIVLGGQVVRLAVGRVAPRTLLRVGVALQLLGGAALVVAATGERGCRSCCRRCSSSRWRPAC